MVLCLCGTPIRSFLNFLNVIFLGPFEAYLFKVTVNTRTCTHTCMYTPGTSHHSRSLEEYIPLQHVFPKGQHIHLCRPFYTVFQILHSLPCSPILPGTHSQPLSSDPHTLSSYFSASLITLCAAATWPIPLCAALGEV